MRLLPQPRPEGSCREISQKIYPSPDKALRAIVLPSDVSLYATPDMESRVVIRNSGAAMRLTTSSSLSVSESGCNI